MTDPFSEPEDATPLEPEEREGLLPSWIASRADLNRAERENIVAGLAWARRQRRTDILTDAFLRRLHGRMFGEVWAWAGAYRRSERNIGIAAHRIGAEVAMLLDDIRYWIAHGTFAPDEIAVRLHHRLVAIHPFPNGNGRHARLLADLAAERLGRPAFTWGRANLTDIGETRRRYIAALRTADAHDIGPLLAFARS